MKKQLNIYFTAGAPFLDSTSDIIELLQSAGADRIEIGIPYSDPVADGPVIQEAHTLALKNGMGIQVLFNQLLECKNDIRIPIVLMGYFNPILQYGFEAFCENCQKIGVKGLIIPDLPPYELESTYLEILNRFGLEFSCLITPETSDDRIAYLDGLSSGFLYAVSSSSTTGVKKTKISTDYLERLKHLNTKNPIMVGFGIATPSDFDEVCQYVSGGIIGTAFVKLLLEPSKDWKSNASDFVKSLK